MKSSDAMRRLKRGSLKRGVRATLTGAVAAGLVAAMCGPALAASEPQSGSSPAPSYQQQVLATNGDNGIDPVLGKYYRIPALADLGNGVVLAAYDARPDGGDAPSANSIVQRRSTDGGKTWGAPTYIARGQLASGSTPKYGFSDPSYVVDQETGTIFNFHVYSKDQGFGGSSWGTDDADRQVISSEVSVSTDGGVSWSTDPSSQPTLPTPSSYPDGSAYAGFAGPLVTNVVKPAGTTVGAVAGVGGVKGVFAASGEGIQLKYGLHKGRLIQQFTGVVRQADGTTEYQAYSVYSDDHGTTWQRGAFTGTGMDENKVVELSNGNVMLNSRASSGGNGGRKVAISTDGGATYGPVTVDTTLADPVNNASIIRMFPDAAEGSPEARMLLFSNANSTSSRSNGTIRYSCDDGTTWSAGKQFKAGAMSYSTLTSLGDGNFGVFYEGDNNAMTFGAFNAAWVGAFCGAQVTGAALTGANGATVNASLAVSNNGSAVLPAGLATFTAKPGWDFGSAAVPSLAPGTSATVTVPVNIPAYAKAGSINLNAQVDFGIGSAAATVPVAITGGAANNIVGAQITGQRNDSGRDLATTPYAAGSTVPYKFTVASLGNITESVVPQSGAFKPFVPADGAGNCRYTSLPVWAGYDCGSPQHTVTADEAAQGFFVPVTTWQVTGSGATTQNYTVTGDEVDLMVRNPALEATATQAFNDVDGNGYANPGDTVTTTVSVTNTGNVPLTGVAALALGLDWGTLGVGQSATADTTRPVTGAELAAASAGAVAVQVAGHNGAKGALATATAAVLPLTVEPQEPTTVPDLGTVNVKGQSPVDAGLGTGKYSVGDTVRIHNAPAGQWAYVYMNQHGYRIGWFLADAQGVITFTVPAGTKNGKDTLVTLDSAARLVSFGTFHITP